MVLVDENADKFVWVVENAYKTHFLKKQYIGFVVVSGYLVDWKLVRHML
jgi:hypothetical protein